MVHLPTQSPTDLDLERGEGAGPCPGQKGCGQPQRGNISHMLEGRARNWAFPFFRGVQAKQLPS